MLTSIKKEYRFSTESGKVSFIKSSPLSNIVIAVSQSSVVTVWDVYEKYVLTRCHPPHFTQSMLTKVTDDKGKADFRRILNKDFVSVQQIVAVSVS